MHTFRYIARALESPQQRSEFEQLQQELSVRQSTTCFAQAAVSLIVALIVSGAAAKLFWDSARVPYLGILASAVALGAAGWSVSRYLKGRGHLRQELERFERLQGLRRSLGLDDPAALLPTR